jgi:hypothetical protein
LRGLDLGADDYLVKPFTVAELDARMRAILRRDNLTPRRRRAARASAEQCFGELSAVTRGGEGFAFTLLDVGCKSPPWCARKQIALGPVHRRWLRGSTSKPTSRGEVSARQLARYLHGLLFIRT